MPRIFLLISLIAVATISFAQIPANNECTTATTVTVNTSTSCTNSVSATSLNATQSMAPCAGSVANDVWFQFIAAQTVQVIQLTSTGITNPVIEVFSGSCGSLTSIVCHSDPMQNNQSSRAVSGLTIGNTYYIRVYANFPNGGTFDLCILSPGANDECSGAIEIPLNTGLNWTSYTSGNNKYNSASGSGCVTNQRADGWFKFTAQDTAQLIHIKGNSLTAFSNTRVQVYSGNCGSLTLINGMRYDGAEGNCFFPGTSDNYYTLRGLTSGDTYYVNVMQDMSISSNVTESFYIAIGNVPANDGITGAQEITVNTGTICTSKANGNFRNASPTIDVANNCSSFIGPDLWYKFTATSSRHLIAANFYDAVQTPGYQVYYMNNGDLQPIACGIGNNPYYFNDLTSLTPGTVYYIRVKTGLNYFADRFFDLGVTTPGITVANDDCSTAQTLPTDQQYLSSNAGANFTTGMNSGCIYSGSAPRDVWYTFTPAINASAAIQLVIPNTGIYNSNNLMGFELHTGACGALTRITCANISSGMVSYLNSNVTAGTTYYVRVFAFNTAQPTPFLLAFSGFVDLPVTITAFEAEHTLNGSVQLIWRTEEEANISYYDIERSKNGIQFNQIERIPARNISFPSKYTGEDIAPLAGITFYRLKIVNKDGKVEYSKTVSLNINNNSTGSLQASRKGNFILINNQNTSFKNVTLNFYTATGQLIYSTRKQLIEGVNEIAIPGNTKQPVIIQIISGTTGVKTIKLF